MKRQKGASKKTGDIGKKTKDWGGCCKVETEEPTQGLETWRSGAGRNKGGHAAESRQKVRSWAAKGLCKPCIQRAMTASEGFVFRFVFKTMR